ncbi:right-handed parallel beta-helix repeat-containing protein [Methanobacterium alcaliphilum]|uniref:right-handed parallel beta-helix repeat-containing protein n=1 Tax=Methanobacterium alcaliphilum TaxID=392018 RepID=UPI00200B51E4|nr:right-handed parallel beta-helix repeat-containing protein [Methanobacterium alcaliphilum]MCK9151843.1 right-handed parallel beta-helix repeat-containing protein [Methanobacterium alcaliphilum]
MVKKLFKPGFLAAFFIFFCLLGAVNGANIHNVTNESYSNYFNDSGDINNSEVVEGDVLDLSGTFTDKKMNINRPLNITSTTKTALLVNTTLIILSTGSGSNITNLTINNSEDNTKGIYLLNTENNTIKGNTIHSDGCRGYCVALVGSKYNQIIENNLSESETINGWTHSPLILGDSHYNNISNNNITSNVSNCIYLCTYSFADYSNGNPCTYNNITENNLYGVDTSWCYAIQVMGHHNEIKGNNITGAYRGVSSQSDSEEGNNIIENIIRATDTGIYAGYNCNISGNTIYGLNSTVNGIQSTGSYSTIYNNTISVGSAYGINILGSNNNITENRINTDTKEAIYIYGLSYGNYISGNIIGSNSTGILFQGQSSSKKPRNNVVVNNNINTTSVFSIDAAQSVNTIFLSNILEASGKVGNESINFNTEQNPTAAPLIFDLTDSNYSTYFNDDGTLKESYVVPGDTFRLSGEFYNKNMILSVPLNIMGQIGSVIYNGTITLLESASGSNISNLTIRNNNQNAIILNKSENNTIKANDISVNQELESYGIYLTESDKNIISGNKISATGSSITHGLFLKGSNYNEILLNEIKTNGTGPETGGFSLEFPTLGIYLEESSYNNIMGNIIDTTSSNNPIAGVNFYYNCNHNLVANNEIISSGGGHAYGLTIYQCIEPATNESLSANNYFTGNNITTTGVGYSNGVNLGWYAYNTTLAGNNVITTALNYAYGLVMIGSENSLISGNNFTTQSNITYGAALDHASYNQFIQNYFSGYGNYSIGMGLYSALNNSILKNYITAEGNSNNAIEIINSHSDPIPATNIGIYVITGSKNNQIFENHIATNGRWAVNSTNAENTTVKDNYLVSSVKKGNSAVISLNNDTVRGNYPRNTTITVYSSNITLGGSVDFKARVVDEENNSVSGMVVSFYLDGKYIAKATTNAYGIAVYHYTIGKNAKIGSHTLKAVSNSNTKYNPWTTSRTIIVKGADLKVTKIKISGNNYYITIKNSGSAASKVSYLKVWYTSKKYKVVKVSAIGSGKYKTVKVKFFKYKTHKKKYKYAKINYNRKAIESNYSNNQVKFKK